MARATEQVHSISALPRSQAEDRDERTRAYLISMGIRTLCFLLSGVFIVIVPWTPGVWICIAAAAVLPYPAVVLANRQDKRTHITDHEPVVHRMLAPHSAEPAKDDRPTVIPGTLLGDDD